MQQLQAELQQITNHLTSLEQQQQHIGALHSQFTAIAREYHIETYAIALHTKLESLERVQSNYQQARTETQTYRQQIQQLRLQLHKEASGIDQFISDATSIDRARESLLSLASNNTTLSEYLKNILRSLNAHRKASDAREQARRSELLAAQNYRRSEQEAEQVRAEKATLQQLVMEMEGEQAEDLFTRLQNLQERQQQLPQEFQEALEARGRNEGILSTNQETFTSAQEAHHHAQNERERTYQELLHELTVYPVEQLQVLHQRLNTESAIAAIQTLLDEPLTNQEDHYHATRSKLSEQHNSANLLLLHIYSEVNNLLHEYGTTFDPQGMIRFLNADNATPFELLNQLAEDISQQERLLDERERTLFQNFLLQEMADTIRKHIIDAEDWIRKMNAFLGHTAFVGEHYHLNWAPREREQIRTGSHLAQYYQLLRRQAQTLKEEEVEALVNAFRQEIADLRAEQQTGQNNTESLPFAEGLARIFDYREWFRFEIFVTRPDGTRQHLTDRYFRQRSGAEQYIALYIPFFAALSALYESAGKGAPRLIALDEAFDKVSLTNTRRLLKFLASQNFQWIMTGPRVTGEGTEIPTCARYVMLHNKGDELATGVPSFWNKGQTLSTHTTTER